MKIYISIIVSLVFVGALCLTVFSQGESSSGNFYQKKFDEANEAYEEMHFDKARAAYEELISMEIEEEELYFNLGNTYVQLASNGKAIWAYEKALQLDPRNSKIQYNLNQVSRDLTPEKVFILFQPFVEIRDLLTLNEWAWFFSFCWVLIGFGFMVYCFIPAGVVKSLVLKILIILIFMLLVSFTFTLSKYRELYVVKKGIVLESLISRSGPGEQFKEHLKMPAGQMIRVESSEIDQWIEVYLPGSKEKSFIPSNQVGILN